MFTKKISIINSIKSKKKYEKTAKDAIAKVLSKPSRSKNLKLLLI